MKYLHLVIAALTRRKARTAFTLVSIIAAFLLFGLLNAVRVAFSGGSDTLAGNERLVVASRFSIMTGLPQSLQARIAAIPGVKAVGHQNWFGGVYQDPKNFVLSFAVDENYLDTNPDIVLTPEQRKAFAETRDGALVGKALAERYGWKVGQKVPLISQIFPRKDGDMTWPFTIVGIYDVTPDAPNGADQMFFLHWKYFDEGNQYGQHEVGWYVVQLSDPADADRVAQAIDALSANSDHETKTQTANAFNASFAKQLGNIGLIVTAIVGAVFFTLILLTGNTMAQAVRERIPELAVLKTIGFSNRSVLGLVLAEAVLMLLVGGILGMLLATAVVPALGKGSGGMIQLPQLGIRDWIEGLVLMILIGVVVGVLPALRGMRLRIVDALAGR
ncbi:ABC transporter permease [Dokdonella sp.]|uniref:ABC transporter permease n=1 Tax=Dokdonella sp. TaxID=2291710 RepID=UPI0031BFA328|nr:ABC transporter permease [Dokdonella sp.]